MTAEDKSVSFDITAADDGDRAGDPNAVSKTVPDGEIWYVEGIIADTEDGNNNVTAREIRAGISSADTPNSTVLFDKMSRGAKNGQPQAEGDKVSLGAYAYGGDTVFGGVNQPDNAGKGKLLIRRVL